MQTDSQIGTVTCFAGGIFEGSAYKQFVAQGWAFIRGERLKTICSSRVGVYSRGLIRGYTVTGWPLNTEGLHFR